jgi:hypothetical protein
MKALAFAAGSCFGMALANLVPSDGPTFAAGGQALMGVLLVIYIVRAESTKGVGEG